MKVKKTKKDIVEAVSADSDLEKRDVQQVFDKIINEIKSILENGDSIELRGFGTFEQKLRKGRNNAHNPKTGSKVVMKPHYTVIFKPGKEIKKVLLEIPADK